MTEPVRIISGDGIWHGKDGSRFAFRLDLEAPAGRCCEGTIRWEADDSGTEHVRGTIEGGELRLHGYRLDNPLLLSLDEYRLTLSPGGDDFDGASPQARGERGGTSWRAGCTARLRPFEVWRRSPALDVSSNPQRCCTRTPK